MEFRHASQKSIPHSVATLVLSLLTFLILYVFRSLDDTHFTSWDVALSAHSALIIAAAIAIASLVAYFFLEASFIEIYPSAFLFLVSFAAALLFRTQPEAIVDAARYFTYAKNIESYGLGHFVKEWGHAIGVWTDMPLVPVLYGLIFKYAGEHRLYIQVFIALLFSMTVVLTYRTGKLLWDRDTGLIGGLLLMGFPYLYSQLPLMLVDVPAMFFLLLSVYTFLEAVERGGALLFVAAAALAAAFYVKYSAWLMLSVLIIIVVVSVLIRPRNERATVIRRSLLIFLIASVVVSLFLVYKIDVVSKQIKLLFDYQRPGLERWGESLTSIYLFQVHPLISIAAFFSIYRAVRTKDFRFLIIAWLVLLVIVLRIRRIRYLIMVFPMLSLMAAYGLRLIRNRTTIKYVSFCIVILSLTVAFVGYQPYLKKDSSLNLAMAGEFIDTLPGEDVEIFTLSRPGSEVNPAVSVSLLDLFTKKNVRYHYHGGHRPDADELMTSPLRFTWEFRNPSYYEEDGYEGTGQPPVRSVAIISSDNNVELNPEIRERIKYLNKSRVFNLANDEYEYQTLVTVYY